MTAINPTIREELNASSMNRIDSLGRAIGLGDLLGWLIQDAGNTETGIVPAANVATLAAIPGVLLDLVSTAGVFTGRLALKIGDASVLPASGEAVWDGATSVRLNATDAVTALDAKYIRATNTVSMLDRTLSQQDR